MKAVIVGTGRMGSALVKVFSKRHPGEIGIYSRDAQKAAALISTLGIDVQVVTAADVFNSNIIIHTLWYDDVLQWVATHRAQLAGKILVDITNPFNDNFDDFVTGFDTSSAEEMQKLIPDTKVVGAFKNTYWVVFDNPEYGGIQSDVYVTSNDNLARAAVMQLLEGIPLRIFDAGKLQNNRTIERMTLLSRELAIKAGNHPRVSFHLWGVDGK